METQDIATEQPRYEPVYFWDPDGNPLAGWQVSLDAYVREHEGIPGDWELAHRLVVARAKAKGQIVPDYAFEGHSDELMQRTILRERCLHGDKDACAMLRALKAEAGE